MEPSARELLDKARDCATSAPFVSRVDTTERSVVVLVGQNRVEQMPQTYVVTIDIDMSRQLARQTTTYQGQKLLMLKQGQKAAVKLGSGPWEIPAGPFASMAKDMGNLFVCEIETPEQKRNAPNWKIVGTEFLDGQEAYVIETEGNTAAPLAQERMTKGIAKAYSGNPSQVPTVKVLEYSAKHWISKSEFRRLKAVQTSKVQISFAQPGGTQQLTEQSSRSTSTYSYGKLIIEVPEEARKLLSSAP